MTNTVLLSIENSIAVITFNRPEAMNCYNDVMAEEFAAVTNQVRLDRSVRAVLLRGAGHLFMAGGDIHYFHRGLKQMPGPVMAIVSRLSVAIDNLMTMPKPVLACVHGSVAGVGVGIMLAADLVIAAESTKFNLAYTGIGAAPDGGTTYALPRVVGAKKAMELLLLSEVFDAKTALAYGMINWAVADDQLQQATDKILRRLANGPTQSYAQAKSLVNQSWDNGLHTQLQAEGKAFEICSVSQDFANGVSGFLEKKRPQFTGE